MTESRASRIAATLTGAALVVLALAAYLALGVHMHQAATTGPCPGIASSVEERMRAASPDCTRLHYVPAPR